MGAESSDDSPSGHGLAVDSGVTPVAFTKVRKGFLGYLGMENTNEYAIAIILAMIAAK